MKRKYDLAFSMGFGCGCSKALRAARLQYASYPMDWVGITGLPESVDALVADFGGWFEKGDLRLYDIHRERDAIHRVYVNRRNGFVFGHDFTDGARFDAEYAEAVSRYARRQERLFDSIRAAKRVLAVFVERPSKSAAPDAVLVAARDCLARRFPGVTFGLAYFHHEDGCAVPRPRQVAAGVEAIACSYRLVEYGEISHAIANDQITRYLAETFEVADPRSPEERQAFAARKRSVDRLEGYGNGSRLGCWWNRVLFRLYRRLEEDLKERQILPHEHSPVA